MHAYTGGINIADEYANLFVRFGHWKDTGVRIDGAGAWGFASQFIQMWKMIGRSLPNEDDYYRPRRGDRGQPAGASPSPTVPSTIRTTPSRTPTSS